MAFGDHVKVKLGLDSKGFNQGLSSAQAKAQKFGASFKSGFVGAIGTAIIARASQQIIDFGASIGDLADRVGVSAEFLQKMQFSAEQNGSSVEQANKAVMRLAKSIGDAKDGLSTAVKAFDRAGVTFKKTDGTLKSIEEVAFDLADGMKNMTDDGERVKVAFDLMGRSGLAMTQFMNGGSEAMKEFGDRAERLGFILSNDNVRALQDASGELEKLGRQTKVFGAKILPPLFEGFKKFVAIIQKGIDVLKPYGSTLLQVGKALATYWATAKLIGAGKIFVGGILLAIGAVKKLTGAVVSLNLATTKNPLGALLAVGVLLYPIIDKIFFSTQRVAKALAEMEKKKISQLNDQIEELNKSTLSAMDQLRLINEEIDELTEKPAPDYKAQTNELKAQANSLKEIIAQEEKRGRESANILEIEKKHLQSLKEQEQSGVQNLELSKKIAYSEKFISELSNDIETSKLGSAQANRDLLKTNQDLEDSQRKLANEEFARANGLEKLLENRKQEEVQLERALAKTKAIREGGLAQLEVLERQFDIEDKIASLLKDKEMSLEDARILATRLVDATTEEKRVLKEVNDLQEKAKNLQEEQKKEVEEKIKKLKEEQGLHQQNQAIVDQQLQVLKLRANGQNELANLLQKRIDNEEALLKIQQNQGLELGNAVKQQKEQIALNAKIKANEIDKAKNDLQNAQVKDLAGKKVGDGANREEKKRIRAAKAVEGLEKRIALLKGKGKLGQIDQAQLERLKEVLKQKMGIVLDEQAKKEIAKLDQQKLDLKKDFDQQMKAIDLARAKIEKDKADLKAQAEQNKGALQKEGDAQAVRLRAILDAGALAIQEAGRASVNAIKNLQAPNVNINNINPRNALNGSVNSGEQKVFVVNQLNQGTQDNILQTLKGYFVNQ